MPNGIDIKISEADFKAKSQVEQNWILFQGVVAIRKCVNDVDQHGCYYGRKKYQMNWLKIISAITGGLTGALGIVYIIYRITCR